MQGAHHHPWMENSRPSRLFSAALRSPLPPRSLDLHGRIERSKTEHEHIYRILDLGSLDRWILDLHGRNNTILTNTYASNYVWTLKTSKAEIGCQSLTHTLSTAQPLMVCDGIYMFTHCWIVGSVMENLCWFSSTCILYNCKTNECQPVLSLGKRKSSHIPSKLALNFAQSSSEISSSSSRTSRFRFLNYQRCDALQ